MEFAFFVSAGLDAPPPKAKGDEFVGAGSAAGVGAVDPPPKLKGDDVLPAGACVAPPKTGALVFEPKPPPPNVATFDCCCFGAPNAGGAEF